MDGSDSNTARFVVNYAAIIAATYNNQLVLDRALRRSGRTTPTASVDLESRAWFNADLESRSFYVPGIIANACAKPTFKASRQVMSSIDSA